MYDELFHHIYELRENIHLFDGNAPDIQKECLEYEQKIREEGGVDLQVLGLGLNGHIGFNEPGTLFTSRTYVMELD